MSRIPSRWELKHEADKMQIVNDFCRIPSRWELKRIYELIRRSAFL